MIDAPVISEEFLPRTFPNEGLLWVIDPVDGTINSIVGHADVAVSVALVEVSDGPQSWSTLLGVVFLPFQNTLFSAYRGMGAHRNGSRLLQCLEMHMPIVAIGIPADANLRAHDVAKSFERLISDNWIIRQGGSAAIDICRTAMAQWSAFYEPGIHFWDMAAADLLVHEAGGGRPFVGPIRLPTISFSLIILPHAIKTCFNRWPGF